MSIMLNLNLDPTVSKQEIKLKEARAEFDVVDSNYTTQVQKLYRQDGSPMYAPAEHEERLRVLREEFQAATTAIIDKTHALRAELATELAAVGVDPLLRLTTDKERNDAIYKSPLIQDAVNTLSVGALAATLRTIVEEGDRVEQILHSRFAARRLEAEKMKALAGGSPDTSYPAATLALAELDRKLDGGKSKERKEKLKALEQDSWALTRKITGRVREMSEPAKHISF